MDLPIVLRKEPRTKAGKPPKRYMDEQDTIVAKKALQTARDDHDIGNFVSYEVLSPSYKAFVVSLQTTSIPKDWKTAKQDPK